MSASAKCGDAALSVLPSLLLFSAAHRLFRKVAVQCMGYCVDNENRIHVKGLTVGAIAYKTYARRCMIPEGCVLLLNVCRSRYAARWGV